MLTVKAKRVLLQNKFRATEVILLEVQQWKQSQLGIQADRCWQVLSGEHIFTAMQHFGWTCLEKKSMRQWRHKDGRMFKFLTDCIKSEGMALWSVEKPETSAKSSKR